jgi:hypothetical protein
MSTANFSNTEEARRNRLEEAIKAGYASMGLDATIGGKETDEVADDVGVLDEDRLRTMPVPTVNSNEELLALFGREGVSKRFNDYILRTLKNHPEGIHEYPTWKSALRNFNALIKDRVPFNIRKMKAQKRLGCVAIPALFSLPLSELPDDDETKRFISIFQDGHMRRWFHTKRCCVLPHIAICPFGAGPGRMIIGLQIAFMYSDTPEMFETMKTFYD